MKKTHLLLVILFLGIMAFGQLKAQNSDDSIILTWSSASFVPAWYQGKALPSSGSQITVSASPEIFIQQQKDLRLQDLNYKWFLNYTFQNEASGQGRQDFVFTGQGAKGTKYRIKVEIYSPKGVLLGEKSITAELREPTVKIYHLRDQMPLAALKNQYDLSPGEKTDLMAVPFFFNLSDFGQIGWRWFLDGKLQTGAPERPDIINIPIPKDMPSGTVYNLESEIKNNLREKETIRDLIRITIK